MVRHVMLDSQDLLFSFLNKEFFPFLSTFYSSRRRNGLTEPIITLKGGKKHCDWLKESQTSQSL